MNTLRNFGDRRHNLEISPDCRQIGCSPQARARKKFEHLDVARLCGYSLVTKHAFEAKDMIEQELQRKIEDFRELGVPPP
jgi:hypothetical protein